MNQDKSFDFNKQNSPLEQICETISQPTNWLSLWDGGWLVQSYGVRLYLFPSKTLFVEIFLDQCSLRDIGKLKIIEE